MLWNSEKDAEESGRGPHGSRWSGALQHLGERVAGDGFRPPSHRIGSVGVDHPGRPCQPCRSPLTLVGAVLLRCGSHYES